MRDYELYVILDRELLAERDLIEFAKGLVNKGINIVQYRDKISSLSEVRNNSIRLKKTGIPVLIINDYPQIARDADADGVHLGQSDMGIAKARTILCENKIIGHSTHNLEQALEAQQQGADYIGIGPVYYTDTKKDVLPIGLDVVREVVQKINIPVVAIGGINMDNIDKVLAAGVTRIAMASALLKESFSWDRYRKHVEAILQKK